MNAPGTTAQFRLSRSLSSRLDEVEAVCREIRLAFSEAGMGSQSFTVELVARESLNNAVLHGNAGNKARRVDLDLRSARKWICLRVSDEGAGFNWRRIRKRSARAADDATSGRGLLIVAKYADRVRFNRQGNEVTLWIKK